MKTAIQDFMERMDSPDERLKNARPLADRMRPETLEEYVGQSHILEKGGLLHKAIQEDRLFSMLFWGPPGSGKTTLARIIAGETKAHFATFSAVLSGVKEIRGVIEEARLELERTGRRSTGSTRPSKTPFCPTWRAASSR
jgi:putative ATPase